MKLDMEILKEIIRKVCANNGKEPPATITPQTHLRKDLNFDSYDLAELTVLLEDAFGVDIFEDGIVNNVGDICKKLDA